jgi:hypothetical protein
LLFFGLGLALRFGEWGHLRRRFDPLAPVQQSFHGEDLDFRMVLVVPERGKVSILEIAALALFTQVVLK